MCTVLTFLYKVGLKKVFDQPAGWALDQKSESKCQNNIFTLLKLFRPGRQSSYTTDILRSKNLRKINVKSAHKICYAINMSKFTASRSGRGNY